MNDFIMVYNCYYKCCDLTVVCASSMNTGLSRDAPMWLPQIFKQYTRVMKV